MLPESISEEVIAFCKSLASGEREKLVFKKQVFSGIPNSWLATQSSLQALAAKKIPSWDTIPGLVYPDKEALEQCTSELVASWKKSLVPRETDLLADLSAGLGVDGFSLAADISNLVLFDPDENRAKFLVHNANKIRQLSTEVICGPATDVHLETLAEGKKCPFFYVDPDRRNVEGKRLSHWRECQPDVSRIYEVLKKTSARLLVKFSPLDDPEEICEALGGAKAVYVVSVHNEVKEVLILWDFSALTETTDYYACNLLRSGEVDCRKIPIQLLGRPLPGRAQKGHFLLDPWAALRKGRFSKCMAEEAGWTKLSGTARLFSVGDIPEFFPGRIFRIEDIIDGLSSFGKQHSGMDFHVISRNFPETAEQIRKQFKWTERGNEFIICFCNDAGEKVILKTKLMD